jgi:hypothetical protein
MEGDIRMAVQKPLDLVRFISNVPVLNDGTIPLNTMDSNTPFVSTMYDPVFSISALARITQDVLSSGTIELVNTPLDPNTIVSLALNSDLASYAPDIYVLLRATILESFALIYHIEIGSANLRYVSPKDFQRARTNINYITDYFSTDQKYHHMIETLRNMNVAFGYIENQIDVILNDKGVK